MTSTGQSLKRFLLFAGEDCCPGGGWSDFRGSYDTVEETRRAWTARTQHYDWWQVIDSTTGQHVEDDFDYDDRPTGP